MAWFLKRLLQVCRHRLTHLNEGIGRLDELERSFSGQAWWRF